MSHFQSYWKHGRTDVSPKFHQGVGAGNNLILKQAANVTVEPSAVLHTLKKKAGHPRSVLQSDATI